MGVRLGLATRNLTTPSGDTQEPEVVEEQSVHNGTVLFHKNTK